MMLLPSNCVQIVSSWDRWRNEIVRRAAHHQARTGRRHLAARVDHRENGAEGPNLVSSPRGARYAAGGFSKRSEGDGYGQCCSCRRAMG